MTSEIDSAARRPAGFWERFLAFAVDMFLVRLLALAIFVAAMAGGLAPGPGPLAVLLIVFFFAYHALWKGASPGARLLGLRAIDASGEPLSPAHGLKRAFGGALYDRSAGTRVIGLKPRSTLGKVAVYGACAAIILINGLIVSYNRIVKPELDKAQFVASAQSVLSSLGGFEEIYKSQAGVYTDDISLVAGMADDPIGILRALPKVLDGGKVRIVLSDGGYTLEARALDAARTPVSFRGPKKAK